jgi:hypothetical protein
MGYTFAGNLLTDSAVFCFVFFKQQPQHQADKNKNTDVEQCINQTTHLFLLYPL